MSSIRYLEFDSTYRDRVTYPTPSTFVVEMSQSGLGTPLTAKDPICNASPILVWNNTFAQGFFTNTIVNITVSPVALPSTQGNTTFMITTAGPPDNLRQIRNFYVGSTLGITVGGITTVRRIVEYLPINLATALITIDSALPDSLIGVAGFHIDNPTPIPTNTPNSEIKVYVPGSNNNSSLFRSQTFGLGGDNYYIGYYLQNTDTGTVRLITAFDGATRLATLESATPGGEDWAQGGINFVIRKDLPTVFNGTTTVVPSQINLGVAASTTDNIYVGSFLRIPQVGLPTSPVTPPYNQERKIVAYDGVTRIATVSPSFTGLAPLAPIVVELEQFTRDNATQFNFTGSLVTGDEKATYEVELLNLILPNTTLASGRGGRAIFYPYLYVELQALSTSSYQTRNILYSNNPNSVRMLFRAVVDDTPIPVISPFIKIDGDGMVHTITVKPNDTFRFSVYHTNGELFETVIEDTVSPTAPNPLAQISACFAFRKV